MFAAGPFVYHSNGLGPTEATASMPLREYDRLKEELRHAHASKEAQDKLIAQLYAAYDEAVQVAVTGLGFEMNGSYVTGPDGRVVFFCRQGALGQGFRVEPSNNDRGQDPLYPLYFNIPGNHGGTLAQLLRTVKPYLERPFKPAPVKPERSTRASRK